MGDYIYIAVFAGVYSAIVTMALIVVLVRGALIRAGQERELRFFEISEDKLLGRVVDAECRLECAESDAAYYKRECNELRKRLGEEYEELEQ